MISVFENNYNYSILSNPLLSAPPIENVVFTNSGIFGTLNFDLMNQSVIYWRGDSIGNFQINFRARSNLPLVNFLSDGQSISCALMVTNGATPYYATGFSIDGSNITPKWQYGVPPTGGNANSIDIYTFSIMRPGPGQSGISSQFILLASQSRFA